METGYMEKREEERVLAQFPVRFQEIEPAEAERLLASGAYSDVFFTKNLNLDTAPVRDPRSAFTENISVTGLKLIGDLRVVGDKPLPKGLVLSLELEIPGVPQTVRALARVIWSNLAEGQEGRFEAGVFFIGINRMDVQKVERYVLLQKQAQNARKNG